MLWFWLPLLELLHVNTPVWLTAECIAMRGKHSVLSDMCNITYNKPTCHKRPALLFAVPKTLCMSANPPQTHDCLHSDFVCTFSACNQGAILFSNAQV